MREREENIRYIRSNLPYMGGEDLGYVAGFIRSISEFSSFKTSPAEWERPVLSEDEQQNLDSAQRVMDAVQDNIKAGTYTVIMEGESAPGGVNILGEQHGDTVAVSLGSLWKVYNEIWGIRLTKAAIAEALEASGVILPRSEHPKSATIMGSRKEAVYIPASKAKIFTGKESSL